MKCYISQIVLLPEGEYISLLPCDGRYLLALEHKGLYDLIGEQYGYTSAANSHNEPPKYYFALPNIKSPLEGYQYYICIEGVCPQLK